MTLGADKGIEYNRSKDPTVKIESTTTTARVIGEARNRSDVGKPTTSSSSEVHLSELAAQLQSPADGSSFDVTRIAEIKQAIGDGLFAINSAAIADRLIASASDLVNSQRQA